MLYAIADMVSWITRIDSTFNPNKQTHRDLAKYPALRKWLKAHTRKHKYIVEIFKCKDASCCARPRMPEAVFDQSFSRHRLVPFPMEGSLDSNGVIEVDDVIAVRGRAVAVRREVVEHQVHLGFGPHGARAPA